MLWSVRSDAARYKLTSPTRTYKDTWDSSRYVEPTINKKADDAIIRALESTRAATFDAARAR